MDRNVSRPSVRTALPPSVMIIYHVSLRFLGVTVCLLYAFFTVPTSYF
jgi:heme O synthase-like polyprenyltransferase